MVSEGKHDKRVAAEDGSRHSAAIGTRTLIGRFPRVWAVIYLLLLLVFEIALFMLDLLPMRTLLIVFVVLTAISAVIYVLLSKRRGRTGPRVAALAVSALLAFLYCAGTVYAMNTVSFLDAITHKGQHESEAPSRVVSEPFNLYITGIDTWDTIDEEGRSDVNMLVTVNPETHKILLVSIPRDYKVNVVGTEYTDKLTHTGMHGVDMTLSSVEDLLGIRIDYYVKVNFNTIREFVDAIGGVDVVSEYEFTSDYGGDHVEYHFVEGLNHLDGAQALAFARERKAFLTGDHQRVKNQQIVFSAILDKTLSSSTILVSYTGILNSVKDYMETSMPARDIKALVKYQMLYMKGWSIDRWSLTGPGATESTYSGGPAYIMLHDEASIETAKELISAVWNDETDLSGYFPYEEDADNADVIGGDAVGDGA